MTIENKPQAYIDNYTRFKGHLLKIDERVFVPNCETGLLVDHFMNYIDLSGLRSGLVIDVGTGSGNIAVALGLRFPELRIIATDISRDALAVAGLNIEASNLKNVELLHTDLVAGVDENPVGIICNLPWGNEEYMLKSNSTGTLSFMPAIALYPENGVIGSYLALCRQVWDKKWNCVIFAEIGRIPEAVIKREMPEFYNWRYLSVHPDYAILIIEFSNGK